MASKNINKIQSYFFISLKKKYKKTMLHRVHSRRFEKRSVSNRDKDKSEALSAEEKKPMQKKVLVNMYLLYNNLSLCYYYPTSFTFGEGVSYMYQSCQRYKMYKTLTYICFNRVAAKLLCFFI